MQQMMSSVQENLNPDHEMYSETDICKDFRENLNIQQNDDEILLQENQAEYHNTNEEYEEENDEEEEEEEEEFSFMCVGGDENGSSSPIAAEDIFINGQIKTLNYPLFNMEYSVENSSSFLHADNLPMKPPVNKVFVETILFDDHDDEKKNKKIEDDVISGPYCELRTRKVVEAASSDQVCKKSNSTGFSRIWRLKEMVGMRSNSDGRDAFVFLNNGGAAAVEKVEVKRKIKKSGEKGKMVNVSAHEVYLKSKAKDEDRRRSTTYLPYRPRVGFFTNVNGGLTKNVHPF